MAVSSVSVGELVYGAEKSAFPQQNLAVVTSFVARLTVLPFGEKAAWHFGQIRSELEKAGRPIGAYEPVLKSGHVKHDLIFKQALAVTSEGAQHRSADMAHRFRKPEL